MSDPPKWSLPLAPQRLDPNVNEFYLVKRLPRGCHKLWHPHSCGFKNKFKLFLTVFISWHTLIYCLCWKHTCPYASTGKHRYHQWFVWRWGMPHAPKNEPNNWGYCGKNHKVQTKFMVLVSRFIVGFTRFIMKTYHMIIKLPFIINCWFTVVYYIDCFCSLGS